MISRAQILAVSLLLSLSSAGSYAGSFRDRCASLLPQSLQHYVRTPTPEEKFKKKVRTTFLAASWNRGSKKLPKDFPEPSDAELREDLHAVWSLMNDEQIFLGYLEDNLSRAQRRAPVRFKEALEESQGTQLPIHFVYRVIREHVVGRHQEIEVIEDQLLDIDFRRLISRGPFLDEGAGETFWSHGYHSHLIQHDYVMRMHFKGRPQAAKKFWTYLGTDQGFEYWKKLFDSFEPHPLRRPEEMTRQILGKIFSGKI